MSCRLPGMMRYRNERLWYNKLTDSIFPNSTFYQQINKQKCTQGWAPYKELLKQLLAELLVECWHTVNAH